MQFNFKQLAWDSFMGHSKTKMVVVAGISVISIALVSFQLVAKPNEIVKTPEQHTQIVTHESDLNTVSLTEDAYRKLGIQVMPIKRETIITGKTYGAEIMVPAGGRVSISAPISGKLISLGSDVLNAGAKVKQGQLLYRIQPILTADTRANMVNALADADSLVNTAKSQVDAAEIALKRAKKLLDDLVGSQRNVDEANATHEVALRNLEAANVKKAALVQVVNAGNVSPIDVKAPQSGVISNVLAVSGQLLSAGNPIIEISELNTLWVRVPVPVSELNEIDQQADAKISQLGSGSKISVITAKPISAPPTADPLTSTAHLYYVIPNVQSALKPAQRVSVSLNTFGQQHRVLKIPWSAVVLDIYGGSWVYTQKLDTTFERKRVFLDHVQDGHAVMVEGPPEGSKIVINGALELFGVETGFTH